MESHHAYSSFVFKVLWFVIECPIVGKHDKGNHFASCSLNKRAIRCHLGFVFFSRSVSEIYHCTHWNVRHFYNWITFVEWNLLSSTFSRE